MSEQSGFNHPLGDLKLFEPGKNDMRIDYPELAEVPEFKDLDSPSDLKFVWYVSNRTSPLVTNENLTKSERWQEAAILSYGKGAVYRKDVKDIFEGKFPEKIKAAINVMASYNPHIRLRAKMMDEYSLDVIDKMTFMPDDVLQLMDTDAKRKHMDLVLSSAEKRVKLIAQIEKGYGISLKNKKKEEISYKDIPTLADIIDELD